MATNKQKIFLSKTRTGKWSRDRSERLRSVQLPFLGWTWTHHYRQGSFHVDATGVCATKLVFMFSFFLFCAAFISFRWGTKLASEERSYNSCASNLLKAARNRWLWRLVWRPMTKLAMPCEHSFWEQCVPFFASSICEHLRVLCERGRQPRTGEPCFWRSLNPLRWGRTNWSWCFCWGFVSRRGLSCPGTRLQIRNLPMGARLTAVPTPRQMGQPSVRCQRAIPFVWKGKLRITAWMRDKIFFLTLLEINTTCVENWLKSSSLRLQLRKDDLSFCFKENEAFPDLTFLKTRNTRMASLRGFCAGKVELETVVACRFYAVFCYTNAGSAVIPQQTREVGRQESSGTDIQRLWSKITSPLQAVFQFKCSCSCYIQKLLLPSCTEVWRICD